MKQETKDAIYSEIKRGRIERITSPQGVKGAYIWPEALRAIQESDTSLDLRLSVISDRQTVDAYILKNWDELLFKAKGEIAPYPFCHHPDKCAPTSTCQRDPICCD